MVRQVKKLKRKAVVIPKTKTGRINIQEIPRQHPIILNQGKALQITIGQKNITHERVSQAA